MITAVGSWFTAVHSTGRSGRRQTRPPASLDPSSVTILGTTWGSSSPACARPVDDGPPTGDDGEMSGDNPVTSKIPLDLVVCVPQSGAHTGSAAPPGRWRGQSVGCTGEWGDPLGGDSNGGGTGVPYDGARAAPAVHSRRPHRAASAPHEGIVAGFRAGPSPGRAAAPVRRWGCGATTAAGSGSPVPWRPDDAHTRGAGSPAPSRRAKSELARRG